MKAPMRTLNRLWTAAAALLLVAAMTGCIDKESVQTLFFEESGELTWVVHESEIRSDDSDLADRHREEQDYLDDLYDSRNPAAEALALLGPNSLDTVVLRTRRPFEARTEARFLDIGDAFRYFFDGLGVIADVELVTAGGLRSLHIDIDLAATLQAYDALEEADGEEDMPVLELWPDSIETRLVLASGSFVYGEGFDIDGDVATPADWGELFERDVDELQLVLSWTVD